MPQQTNKNQICEKIIGPSHYSAPGFNVTYFDDLGYSLYTVETL